MKPSSIIVSLKPDEITAREKDTKKNTANIVAPIIFFNVYMGIQGEWLEHRTVREVLPLGSHISIIVSSIHPSVCVLPNLYGRKTAQFP